MTEEEHSSYRSEEWQVSKAGSSWLGRLRLANNTRSKIDWFRDFLSHGNPMNIVVYSSFSATLRDLLSDLRSRFVSAALIDSTTPKSQADKDYRLFAQGKIKVLLLAEAASTGSTLERTEHLVMWEPQLNSEVLRQLVKRTSPAQGRPAVMELVWGRPGTELAAGMGETVDEVTGRLAASREKRVFAFHEGLTEATRGSEDHTHPMWTSNGTLPTPQHHVTPKHLVLIEEKLTPSGTYSDGKDACQPWGDPTRTIENVTKRSYSLADIMARKRS